MDIRDSIRQELKKNNAVLVAHYYVSGDLQDLAEETGELFLILLRWLDLVRTQMQI